MIEVTLKELVEKQLQNIERRLDELTRAIEKLTEGTVREERFKSAMIKVSELQTAVKNLDERLDDAEAQLKTYRAIGAVAIALLIIVLGAYLKRVLGL